MRVVATINLPGLSAGSAAEADPEVEYVRDCLLEGWLIPLEEDTDQEEEHGVDS